MPGHEAAPAEGAGQDCVGARSAVARVSIGARTAVARVSIGANVVGALVVYLYLQFLSQGIIDRHLPRSAFAVSMAVFGAYLAGTAVTSLFVMWPAVGASRWLDEGRPPTTEEARITLGVPRRLTACTVLGWSGAALLYGVMDAAYGETATEVIHVVVGILLGGLVTTAITYLLAERRHRPVVVAALGGQPLPGRRAAIRDRLLVAWAAGSAVPLVALGLTPFVHGSAAFVSLQVSIASLAALGLVAGFLITSTTAASVSEPLANVRRALASVRGGDLSVQVEVDDPGEIGRLEADVNRMVMSLRERQQLEDLFGRHVGEAVARRALEQGTLSLGGTQRQASVLFVDLIGSTALALRRPPAEVVAVLNALFAVVVAAVTAEGGWVNKFEGDGALCVFGVPDEQPDHAERALRAARLLRRGLAAAAADTVGLDAGVGVASGVVVAGNIGAVDRYEYTVIGDPVNEAARLSELAKGDDRRLLASATVVTLAGRGEQEHWEPEGEALLRGRDQPTLVMRPTVPAPAADAPSPAGAVQPPATAGTIETV